MPYVDDWTVFTEINVEIGGEITILKVEVRSPKWPLRKQASMRFKRKNRSEIKSIVQDHINSLKHDLEKKGYAISLGRGFVVDDAPNEI